MAKAKSKKRLTPKPYTTADIKLPRQHFEGNNAVSKISELLKRSVGSLRALCACQVSPKKTTVNSIVSVVG